jgi:hypothetical protein
MGVLKWTCPVAVVKFYVLLRRADLLFNWTLFA